MMMRTSAQLSFRLQQQVRHTWWHGGSSCCAVAVPARGFHLNNSQASISTVGFTHPTPSAAPRLIEGIPLTEYADRRRKLLEMLPLNSVVVVTAATTVYMSNDIPYRFRQDSNFRYLCGFHEPDAVLVLMSARTGCEPSTTIAVLPKDPHREKWDGQRVGAAAAAEFLGLDAAVELTELTELVSAAAAAADRVFFNTQPYTNTHAHAVILPALNASGHPENSVSPIIQLQKLRAVKSEAELAVIAQACSISSAAVVDAMRASKPGVSEHLLDAILEFGMRSRGGKFQAYPPVVAGGQRANTLHYVTNDMCVAGGEMVLIDAGAEFQGYAGDISRTWPVNGTYSEAQREVYDAVLRVQLHCLELCRPGMTLARLHETSEALTLEELKRLGVCNVSAGREQLKRFYPHNIGHHLGLDVHDVQSIPSYRELEEGMVITIEPGLHVFSLVPLIT